MSTLALFIPFVQDVPPKQEAVLSAVQLNLHNVVLRDTSVDVSYENTNTHALGGRARKILSLLGVSEGSSRQ